MIRALSILQTYLVAALPFVLALIFWQALSPPESLSGGLKVLADVLSWNLMFWFAALAFFLVVLLLWPVARERTLKRLANLKERDERELLITGRAARSAYIASIALLICLLFFSVFSLTLRENPPDAAFGRHTVSIGLELKFLDEPRETQNTAGSIVDISGLPLSKPAIILLLLLWQLGAFSLSARRQLGRDA